METQVILHGLKELKRDLAKIDRGIDTELRPVLRVAAEPVRRTAQQLAADEISNIGQPWSQMRIGVTRKMVYVAPKSRRTDGDPRPNLATLLQTRAMDPALAANEAEVTRAIELFIDNLVDRAD